MTSTPATDWYAPLQDRLSLGSITPKATRLGDLAARRQAHLSQFFTPAPLAAFMWRCVAPALNAASSEGRVVSLLDNSIGSGRLVRYATPGLHTIAGLDVDAACVNSLGEVLSDAGFEHDLLVAGMQEVNPRGFDLCLLNPPFSLTLQSPTLLPLAPTTTGRFGANTAALSHEYALAQALEAAHLVVAVMPRSWVDRLDRAPWATERLVHVFHAPAGTFRSEGTEVDVSVLVYGDMPSPGYGITMLADLDVSPQLPVSLPPTSASAGPKPLRRIGVEASEPTIVLPVTGDRRVRVVRHRHELRLKFACGLVQARVANALLRRDVMQDGTDRHRYPVGIRYAGQGQLDLEVLASQDDPTHALKKTLAQITAAGGEPVVDPGLWPYFRRLVRRRAVESTPLSHTVFLPNAAAAHRGTTLAATFTARARTKHVMNPKVWGSPVVQAGSAWTFTRAPQAEGERYTTRSPHGEEYSVTRDELLARFEVTLPEATTAGEGWREIAAGRIAAFPSLAAAVRVRAERAGLPGVLSWDFQRTDVLEAAMTRGSVIAGEMGTGKTREGIALAMLGGRHNLIVVEAHIVGEWEDELRRLGVPAEAWQSIQSPEDAAALRHINLITFDRLRRPLYGMQGRRTYARLLRGRINTLIVDEAHCLANTASLQVQALYLLSAKRRYLLTGTPIGNYPRDLLPLAQFTLGQGTAAQPYGRFRPYIEPRLSLSCDFAKRGSDAFRESFVVTEWTTHDFELSDMQKGAKREVPKLANLTAFREFAGRVVKRRVLAEPAVAKHVRIPPPTREVVTVPWNPRHLAFYLDVADSFAQWFREAKRQAGLTGKQVNLMALLAQINAVVLANNCPQKGVGHRAPFQGLTAKDEAVLERIQEHVDDGRQTICYAANPLTLEIYAKHLRADDIGCTVIHGGIAPRLRHQRLNEGFKTGATQVLLATLGVAETGLNIPQAQAIVFNARSWSPRVENQAEARALRPQQTRNVIITRFQHEGSIDEYQATMVAMKADAARAGLDWGTPEHQGTPWLHWAHILGEFLEGLGKLHGKTHHDIREELKHVA